MFMRDDNTGSARRVKKCTHICVNQLFIQHIVKTEKEEKEMEQASATEKRGGGGGGGRMEEREGGREGGRECNSKRE